MNAAIRQRLGKQAGDTVRVTMYRDVAHGLSTETDVRACLEDAGVLALFSARPPDEQQALLHEVLLQPNAA